MKLGFRAKVLTAITLMTVCASLTIAFAYWNRMRADIEENYVQTLWQSMSVSLGAFDENARRAYDTAVALSFDGELAGLAADYAAEGGAGARDALPLSDRLAEAGRVVDNLRSVYLYLPASREVVTSASYHAVQELAPGRSAWLTRAPEAGLSPQLVYDDVSRVPEHMLSYRARLGDGGADEPLLCVSLDERRLFYQYLSELDAGDSSALLLGPDGVIVSASDQRLVGQPFAAAAGINRTLLAPGQRACAFGDGPDRLIAAVRSPFTGCVLAVSSDRRSLAASLHSQLAYLVGFLVVVLAVMLAVALRMSRTMYKPIGNLRRAMARVSEGDLSARAMVFTEDEIGQLGEGFNRMVEQIEGLIGDLVSEQMAKKEAEIEALQYQITPHFMYNTLNSIKYAAILQGNEQVGEQLGAFIELLQASIRRGGAFVPVRDELRFVRNYVKLQQFRYMGGFSVTYDVSPEAEACCVPRLLLQPLVENAIVHGQPTDGSPLHITVAAVCVGDTLALSVEDTGPGMTREQIVKLLAGEGAKKGGFSGIGVSNIRERLRLYYGDQGVLHYTSGEHGTKAAVFLPATTDPEAYTI